MGDEVYVSPTGLVRETVRATIGKCWNDAYQVASSTGYGADGVNMDLGNLFAQEFRTTMIRHAGDSLYSGKEVWANFLEGLGVALSRPAIAKASGKKRQSKPSVDRCRKCNRPLTSKCMTRPGFGPTCWALIGPESQAIALEDAKKAPEA